MSCRLARGLYEGPIVFLPAVPFLQLDVMVFFHCTGQGGSEQQSHYAVQLNLLKLITPRSRVPIRNVYSNSKSETETQT